MPYHRWGVKMANSDKANRVAAIFATLATMLCGVGASFAADITPMPTKAIVAPVTVLSPWTYSFTPYAWLTSLNGTTTVKGRATDIDASFIDILDHTKIPIDLMELAAYFEARNGRFSVFADAIYMKIGLNASIEFARAASMRSGSRSARLLD